MKYRQHLFFKDKLLKRVWDNPGPERFTIYYGDFFRDLSWTQPFLPF